MRCVLYIEERRLGNGNVVLVFFREGGSRNRAGFGGREDRV